LTFGALLDNLKLHREEAYFGLDKDKILGIAQKYILKGQTKKAITEYLKLIQASPKINDCT